MSLVPQRTSALCSYSLPYVDKLFDQNIHMCFNGTMHHRNLPYISGPVDNGKCPTAGSSGNIASFCEAALKISGPSPIVQEIGLSLGTHLGTSVTGTTVGDNMVVLVGTSHGKMVKVLLTLGRPAIVETFRVAPDGEKVLPGTVMHANNVDVLVLTERRLRRVRAADCSKIGFCG
jgi:plexin A